MENHPIPQDVTGFQFKLIGSMTIKQFAYVAFGVIMAVVVYYAPANTLIKILLIPIFGASGLIIAFLPVEGRPVDTMIGNFLKAIFSPNQFVYRKNAQPFAFMSTTPVQNQQLLRQKTADTGSNIDKQNSLQAILQQTKSDTQSNLDQKESTFLQSIATPVVISVPAATAGIPPPQTTPPVLTVPAVEQNTPTPSSLAEQENLLNHELDQAKKHDANKPKIALLERQMQTLHLQKQQLEQQLQQLQSQIVPKTQQLSPQQHVHNIPKEMTKTAGLPHVSDTPNVIVGIVKDSRGNVLPGMLVEVKDKDGNPVRAFKTNQLGQFASATPLASGIYTIQIDDPKKQHNFDIIQITANNQILLPFEIISHDAREELRKELFN